MFTRPSLTIRIGVGKAAGLVIGLVGFILLPMIAPDADPMFRWGILLWYATIGAVIGVFGVYDRHPVLRLPMPWWVRAPLIGAWFNFVLVLFAYPQLREVMVAFFGDGSAMTSPFWFVAEGGIVGMLIGFAATRIGGEGPDTAREIGA